MNSTGTPMIAALGVLGILVTGCGGTSTAQPTDPRSSAPGSRSTIAVTTPPDATAVVVPKLRPGAKGIISETDVVRCDDQPGNVMAVGTVTNPAPGPRDIVIVMNWATTSSGDVVSRGVVVLRQVPKGATMDWSLQGTPLTSDQPVACVPTADAGTLAGG